MKEVFYDPKGVCLSKWLGQHARTLNGYNVFYIVQPIADMSRAVNIFKFGIAISAHNGSANRLRHYVHQHGVVKPRSCLGVKLLYLAKTKNNEENVEYKNTDVFTTELNMKRYVKNRKTLIQHRGGERTRMPLDEFMRVLRGKFMTEDKVTDVKRSERTKQTKETKAIPKYKVGQIWMVEWEGGDKGGEYGDYKAEIIKINKHSMLIKYLDDGGIRHLQEKDYMIIKKYVSN